MGSASGGQRSSAGGASGTVHCPLWVPIGGAAVVGLVNAGHCGHGSDDCLSSLVVSFVLVLLPLFGLITAAISLVPLLAGLFVDAFTTAPSWLLLWPRWADRMASCAAFSFPSPSFPNTSIMAFVLPTGAVGASSVTGTRVAAPAVCANAIIAMRAGGDAPATRRAVLAGALAAAGLAILPGSAMAKGGEGAKQSFFGAGSISNPFTYNEKAKGPVVYKVRMRLLRGPL